MNKKYDEQIFDSLVREMLTGEHPPDLTDQIVDAWDREQATRHTRAGDGKPKPMVVAELVEQPAENIAAAGPNASSGRSSSVKLSERNKSRTRSTSGEKVSIEGRRTNDRSLTSSYILAALSVAASFVVIAVGWQVFSTAIGPAVVDNSSGTTNSKPEDGGANALENANALVNVDKTSDGTNDDADLDPLQIDDAANERVAASEQPETTKDQGQQLRIDDLPFETPESSLVQEVANNSESGNRPIQKLTSSEVVSELDSRMLKMWQELGATPSQRMSDRELAQQVHQLLTGQPVSQEQLRDFAAANEGLVNDNSLQVGKWAEILTSSESFAKNWANAITSQWLRRASLPLDSDIVGAFSKRLAELIRTSKRWNEVPKLVLGGKIGTEEVDSVDEVFIAALAGGGNHRLMKRFGTNFLNTNLMCVRCHDGETETASPLVGNVASKQSTYWSTLAMLNGVDARGNGYRGERTVLDRQPGLFAGGSSPPLYYDMLDGRVATAQATLPNGAAPSTDMLPREALAEFVADSSAFDKAVVNQMWKLVFGRRLVRPETALDSGAVDDRAEILAFLAAQFRAHDHDLKHLVEWIVSSDAFARKRAVLTPATWMASSEQELLVLQQSDLAFALGAEMKKRSDAKNLESSLASVLKWSSPMRGIEQTNSTLLAQPGVATPDKKRPAKMPAVETPSLSYVLHGERHTASERAFVNRLMSSPRLTQQQRIEHVIALSEYESRSSRLISRAQELLERSEDEEQALLDLLWAVNNSNAG